MKTISANETSPGQLAEWLIDEADQLQLKDDDLAVCLVDSDFDIAKDAELKRAGQKLQRKRKNRCPLDLIGSSPCFKKWYICHF